MKRLSLLLYEPNNLLLISLSGACLVAMNELENLAAVLENGDQVIEVDPQLRELALLPLQRMLDFSARLQATK